MLTGVAGAFARFDLAVGAREAENAGADVHVEAGVAASAIATGRGVAASGVNIAERP